MAQGRAGRLIKSRLEQGTSRKTQRRAERLDDVRDCASMSRKARTRMMAEVPAWRVKDKQQGSRTSRKVQGHIERLEDAQKGPKTGRMMQRRSRKTHGQAERLNDDQKDSRSSSFLKLFDCLLSAKINQNAFVKKIRNSAYSKQNSTELRGLYITLAKTL